MPEEYYAINHSMSRRTPSTMDSAGILAEVVALNGAKGTITLGTGTWRIDLATTIPANARLVVEQGAMLTKSGSGTLTINGPFEAPLAQVFSGFAAGDVTFGPAAASLRPQWFGAIGDKSHDDTAAFQCVLASLTNSWAGTAPVKHIDLPQGDYVISSELTIPSGAANFHIRGKGAVNLWWSGHDLTKSVIRANACYSGKFTGLSFACLDGAYGYAAIAFGGGSMSKHTVERCSVSGGNSGYGGGFRGGWNQIGFDYGFITDGIDANNDHCHFIRCEVENVNKACIRFSMSQSKAHVLTACMLLSRSAWGIGVQSAASFYMFGGAVGSNMVADFVQDGLSGVDGTHVVGVNSEGSSRLYGYPLWWTWATGREYRALEIVESDSGKLYQTTAGGTSGGTAPTGTGSGISDGNVLWNYLGTTAAPLTAGPSSYNPNPWIFDSVRFACESVQLDGIEGLDGRNPVLKPAPTASELDNTQITSSTVGWGAAVNYREGGPLILRNCVFNGALAAGVNRIKVVTIGSSLGPSAVVDGCRFPSSSWKIPPVMGTVGGWAPGPVFPSPRIDMRGNLAWLTTLDYGLTSSIPMRQFYGRPEATGRPFWAANEYAGSATGSLSPSSAMDFYRVLIQGNITAVNLPDGQPGQQCTLEFIQDAVSSFTVSGWASNIQLTDPAGAFVMPSANGAVAIISFRWDPIASKWIEVARTGGRSVPDVTGSAGGNAALASLLSALEALGLITDSST